MKAGEVILEEEPYCHVLSQKHKGSRCDRCFERGESLKKCTGCGQVHYCDRVCQKRDWTLHKKECKCLKAIAPKIPMGSVRLMLRLVLSAQLELPMNSIWSRTLDDFMTHKEDVQNDTKRMEQFAKLVYTLKELAGSVVTLPPGEDLLTLFCKMAINSFTICDGELQEVGTGVYLSGSLIDHSCKPNAVATFHGSTLVVRALEEITDPSPNKIYISYIEQLATTAERQSQLREQYYFDCGCERCLDTQLDDLMTSFCCPQPNCDGVVCLSQGKFKACRKCGTSDFPDVLRKGALAVLEESKQQLVKMEEAKSAGDSGRVYQLCKELLKKTEKIISPMNIYLVKALDLGFDAAIETEEWEKALKYGQRNLEPYRTFYPAQSPNLALQLYKVGKLQLYMQNLEKAFRSLQQAQVILKVTHGTDHPLYKELMLFISQCAEELRVNLEKSGND